MGFLSRATWPWALTIATTFIVRDVLNTPRPTAFGAQTEQIFMAVTFSLYVLAGAYSGARTKAASSGALVAATAHLCGMIMLATWWIAKSYWFLDVMRANPYWVADWDGRSAPALQDRLFWDRVGGFFLGGALFSLIAFAFGSVGGAIGSFLSSEWRSHAPAA